MSVGNNSRVMNPCGRETILLGGSSRKISIYSRSSCEHLSKYDAYGFGFFCAAEKEKGDSHLRCVG